MSNVHFVFPSLSSVIPVSLYKIGAPATPTHLYTEAKAAGFGRFDGGRCWDTAIHEPQTIAGEICPDDLFCVTATVSGYESAVNLCMMAREKGAQTAIGGPWISTRGKEVHARHPWIDHVVVGEGISVLHSILNGVTTRGLVHGSPDNLSTIHAPDYSGWTDADLRFYDKTYRDMIASGAYGKPPASIPAFAFYQSARGCPQRPRCRFCSARTGDKLSWRSAEAYYGDIAAIREQHLGINPLLHVFDTSDSFTSTLRRFGKDHRGIDGVTLTVFSRVNEITGETAEALKCLGVTKVSLGIESGSNASLRQIGKATTVEQNLLAVRLLNEVGIQVYMNFMYGLPNESVESLHRTVDHCLAICSIGNVYRAKGRIVTPLPGCTWFRELVNDHPEVDCNGADWLNPRDLGLAWIKHRTRVTPDDIQSVNLTFVQQAKRMGVTFSSETAVWFG